MNFKRKRLLGWMIAFAAALGVSGQASAAPVFELDGQRTSIEKASKAKGGCAMFADASGVIKCFSTEFGREAQVVDDLRAGLLPPGFGEQPSESVKAKLTGQSAQATAKRKRGKNLARIAGCGVANHAHDGTYQNGTYWYAYNTNWATLPGSGAGYPNNDVTSGTTSNTYHTYYADGNAGTGLIFTQTYNYCHVDDNLALDAFPGGGSWNNRFSSIWSG